MKKISKLSLKWSSLIAAFALIIATASAGSTCFFTAYQPPVPEQLKNR